MRFHVGVSFRLKNLVKFIIPILIGIGAYFGLPVLFGFIPKVNALENYNTSYTLDLPENVPQYFIDDFNDNILTLQSDYNDIVVTYYVYAPSGTIYDFSINIFIIPKVQTQDMYIYYDWRFWIKSPSFDPSIYYYYYKYQNGNESILNTDMYSSFYDCYVNNVCNTANGSDSNLFTNGDIFTGNDITPSATDDNNPVVNTGSLAYYYYSSIPLIISTDSSNVNDSSTFYKTFVVNGDNYGVGDRLPTYYSVYINDEPIPPEPSDKDITDYVYWFFEHYTEYDILVNIYILMFIYFMFNMFMRCIYLIKGVKWD